MKGADEYAALFRTGQHGCLYLVSGSHARGATFRIYVLPEGVEAIPNGESNPPLNKDAVEVFGVTDGQPGWTETYGWLHTGKWQEDFESLISERRGEIEAQQKAQRQYEDEREAAERNRVNRVLDGYR